MTNDNHGLKEQLKAVFMEAVKEYSLLDHAIYSSSSDLNQKEIVDEFLSPVLARAKVDASAEENLRSVVQYRFLVSSSQIINPTLLPKDETPQKNYDDLIAETADFIATFVADNKLRPN